MIKNTIEYSLYIKAPETHIAKIAMSITGIDRENLELAMPVWAPSSYLIRDFSRNIEKIHSKNEKIDKNHWLVYPDEHGNVYVEYDIYLGERSVRTSYMSMRHAQIIPSSVFLYPAKKRNWPVKLHFYIPDTWKIYTPLENIDKGIYAAKSFDELVDSPIDAGEAIKENSFNINGKKHILAFCDMDFYNRKKFVKDCKKICSAAYSIFSEWPNDKPYYFFLHGSSNPGGLEHSCSSSIDVEMRGINSDNRYKNYIPIVAHEYFHMWNVKKIRTSNLLNYDYDKENYTRFLWFHEGVTEFYGDLIPVRAGCHTIFDYIEHLSMAVDNLFHRPGRASSKFSRVQFRCMD